MPSLPDRCSQLLTPATPVSDPLIMDYRYTPVVLAADLYWTSPESSRSPRALLQSGAFRKYFELVFQGRKHTDLLDNLTSHHQPAALLQSSQVFPVYDTVTGLIPMHGKHLLTSEVYRNRLLSYPN